MSTRRTRRADHATEAFLEKLMGGPLSLGGALSAIREAEGESLAAFAEHLQVSRTHLSDIEHGRRSVSPERAARFARRCAKAKPSLFVSHCKTKCAARV